MPGTPPTSPRFSAPRYADGDTAAFSAQVNAVTDAFDAKATLYATGTHAGRLAATATDGLLWRETDTGLLWLGTGSVWLPITLGSRGVTTVTFTVQSTESAAVTVNHGLPVAPTSVLATASAPIGWANPITAQIAGGTITTSTFQVFLNAANQVLAGTVFQVYWHAIV